MRTVPQIFDFVAAVGIRSVACVESGRIAHVERCWPRADHFFPIKILRLLGHIAVQQFHIAHQRGIVKQEASVVQIVVG